jgi:L-seryl-tRNA(Ser) seleniumtransferase
VDRLLRAAGADGELAALPHGELVAIARSLLDEARAVIGRGEPVPALDDLAWELGRRTAVAREARLRPLINATGVIIQTNLGRAPLSDAALRAIERIGAGYSNLEYDLDAGERGSRYEHMTALLARLTGAEAGLAVNNNAAAVLLVLGCFCAGREVLVSRGQAVEIGGGFRIPDVLKQSGATLVEVGTTNRTYARDYADAITDRTAAILTVHRSNFKIVGFTHDPRDDELAAVAREHGILWIDDWGSGSLLQPGNYGLAREPTVADRVAAGCDLVCFSGDKLLGGPQAGLIVGSAKLIGQLRKYPLLRALRVDKLVIAAMEATLLSYLRGRAHDELPVWQMIAAPASMIAARAEQIAGELRRSGIAAEVAACESAIGGGSTPGETLPSFAVALDDDNPDRLAAALRHAQLAVVGRIATDRLLLDLRTVLPSQDALLLDAIKAATNTTNVERNGARADKSVTQG